MRITQWMMRGLTLVVLASSSVLIAEETNSICVVRLYDHPVYKGEVRVQWTSDLETAFELKGADKWLISPQVTLPSKVIDLQIVGSVTWKHVRTEEQTAALSSKSNFVDFTSSIRPLRSQESWGKRMEHFVRELKRIEEQHKDLDVIPSESIESSGSVHSDVIKSAEQRLRFALPNEHKQLLQDYGTWSFSDSFCVSADDLDRVDIQIMSIWGSPKSEFASLSDKSKKLYQASTMLFVEGGDGYGALIYHPITTGGEYYWIHQDSLDEPVKLTNSQNTPRDYSSAMRWVIANQILPNYEDAFDGTIIDRSSLNPLHYQLRLDFPTETTLKTKQVEAKLDVEWSKFD